MSRNGSGTYTLPSGNPVVSGTLIEATWANSTLSDIASSLTDSLSRSGQGGMTAALRLFDGTSSVPGLAWGSETTTGFYRAGAGDTRLVVTGSQVMQFLSTGVAITGTLSASGNATVGGTLGVTGATTLTGALTINGGIANNPTLSAGTANGVAYLNGSKVLTTGSALTFDGTNLGVGTASPTNRLVVSNAGAAGIEIAPGETNGPTIYSYNRSTSAWAPLQTFASQQIFCTNGTTEQMRLTSTGLGIGTSSPSVRLMLEQAANSAPVTLLRLNNSGTTGGGPGIASRISFTAGATALGFIQGSNFASGAAGLQFSGDGTNAQATLDSSGNLGLGVTPSAWGTLKSIDVSTWASFAGFTNQVGVIGNAYFDGSNYRYKQTSFATRYEQNNNGTHSWYTAPSGTAGNAISFTQAMTLDASGNLGVGTTSPNNYAGYGNITLNGSSGGIFDMSVGNTRTGSLYATSSLVVLSARTAIPLVFETNALERARIDSSGNLLVGITAPVTVFNSTGGNNGGYIGTDTTAAAGVVAAGRICFILNRTTSTGVLQEFKYNAAVVGTVSTNGTSTAYNTSSDYRLKNTIAPMTGALARVAALKPCTYKWNSDGSDGEGFIAHELQAVCPDAVTGEKDAVDAEGKPVYQGIDTSFLVATLTAALQEAHGLIKDQAAAIQTLTARVAALEGTQP